jgi:hypothetical protein
MIKKLAITWVIAVLLIWAFLWFGLSDVRHPEEMDQYINRNPMRPLFRIAFGWIMASLVTAAAIYMTRSIGNRSMK